MPHQVYLSGREISLPDNSFIVSKTDTQGNICYANRVFMQLTGYREAELIGQPQNIVRHPDMPKGVFRYLWQELNQGKECFAYINNRAKNGDHYWVFANVSPVRDPQKRVIGFFSARRKPSRKAIEQVLPIYQQMRDIEQKQRSDRGESAMNWMLKTIEQEHGSYEKFILGL